MLPVVCPRRYKPNAANIEDNSNTPDGENLCTTGPAKALPNTITPVSMVSNNRALSLTFFNSTSIHWPVNNSVMAVPNIRMIMIKNNGLSRDLYISKVDTPLETRSVTGNFNLLKRYPYNTVGMSIIPTSTFQLSR